MEFIDRTGHIFSLQTYNDNIGWEYKDNDYIFWFDDVYTNGKLSVNSYYIQQITPYINNINKSGKNNSKIELDKLKQVKISCKSDVFKLIPYNIINKSINSINDNTGAIDIDSIYNKTDNKLDNKITTNLSEIIYNKDEFIIDINSDTDNTNNINTINDIIFPFFIICTYNKPETVMTNVLIEFIYNETLEKESTDENGNLIITEANVERSVYCPIRIGGLFVDESEQLYINMTNMGIELPKSILDGIYQHGLTETGDMDYDIALYNEKLKEYLLHYNIIRGEIGNYKSILSSLKWFGWGDKLKLTKLLKTDNDLLDQFIRDSFDSDEDIVSAFIDFRNSAYISVSFKDNDIIYNKTNENTIKTNNNINNITESIVYNEQDWSHSSDMVGEGLPKLQDLFNRWDKIHFDGCEDINYYQPFYIYNKNIILLKLAFFKYYYKKYFLPVHLSTKTVSMEHTCFIPDIKLYTVSSEHYNNKPILDASSDCEVYICNEPCLTSYYDINNKNINKIHTLYINTDKHYIDSDFCEFEYYNKYDIENNDNINNNIDIYESHELSFAIPITFKCTNDNINKEDYIFNTNIIITKSDHVIYECNKIFRQTDNNETSDGNFKSVVIIPKLNDQLKRYNIDWSTDNSDTDPYIVDVRCNGKWFRSFINIKEPKPEIHTYYLKYLYDNRFSQLKSIDNNNPVFNAFMYHPELITVNDINYTDKLLMDNINKLDLVDNYQEQYNIPSYINKPEYYNLILYYDINITENNYNTDNIYNDLFELNQENNKYEFISDNVNNILNNKVNNIQFDAYIMKTVDDKYYLVFISIGTIDTFNYNDFISNLNKNSINIYKKKDNKDNIIGTVKYSSNKISFLINRMQLIEPEIPNNFDSTNKYNIICCSLYNIYNKLNESIAFAMSCTSKWEITTFSIYNKRQKTVNSNSAFGIISLQDTESDYLKGIYQIKCNWSFDGSRTKSIVSPYRLKIY